jgi:hypothetical protein
MQDGGHVLGPHADRLGWPRGLTTASNFTLICLGHETLVLGSSAGSEVGAGGAGMWVMQAFRFELGPNWEAQIALAKHVGTARFGATTCYLFRP